MSYKRTKTWKGALAKLADKEAKPEVVKEPAPVETSADKTVEESIETIVLGEGEESYWPDPRADFDNYKIFLTENFEAGDLQMVLGRLEDMLSDAEVEVSKMPDEFYDFATRVYEAAIEKTREYIRTGEMDIASDLLDILFDHRTYQLIGSDSLIELEKDYRAAKGVDEK